MSWYIQTERSKCTNIVFFQMDSLLVQQSLWLSLCINEIWKKKLPFFYRPPSWVIISHLTDDSSMKDVLQLTAAIVMASSAKKKKITLQKFRNS